MLGVTSRLISNVIVLWPGIDEAKAVTITLRASVVRRDVVMFFDVHAVWTLISKLHKLVAIVPLAQILPIKNLRF